MLSNPEAASRSPSARSRAAVLCGGAALLLAAACSGDHGTGLTAPPTAAVAAAGSLDERLGAELARHGFTGRIGSTLEARLRRSVDHRVADLGRLLWFDPITGLNDDNSCGGCHSPTNGFGDTQSIAIGIESNMVVGPHRVGPRNQRRTPMVINAAFFPTLMWNSRFASRSGDPFDNRPGFSFPPPEGLTLSHLAHLLQAQAFIPPTERTEAAGFHIPGDNVALRAAVLDRLRGSAGYRRLFAEAFPDVRAGAPMTFDHIGRAIAEFEFTLVFADAPIDRFARGDRVAMSEEQKRGALLFFGRAGCAGCHAVSGGSNEMFSDFREHVAGIPQVVPAVGNVPFDGPGANEDFGLAQVTGRDGDRYAFRTSPLRNVALQPAFFHDGAFTRLEDAVRYHLDAAGEAPRYTPARLAVDLRGPIGPMAPVLARLDARLRRRVALDDGEFRALIEFLRIGLLDPRARPERLRALIPATLPSGRRGMRFELP